MASLTRQERRWIERTAPRLCQFAKLPMFSKATNPDHALALAHAFLIAVGDGEIDGENGLFDPWIEEMWTISEANCRKITQLLEKF